MLFFTVLPLAVLVSSARAEDTPGELQDTWTETICDSTLTVSSYLTEDEAEIWMVTGELLDEEIALIFSEEESLSVWQETVSCKSVVPVGCLDTYPGFLYGEGGVMSGWFYAGFGSSTGGCAAASVSDAAALCAHVPHIAGFGTNAGSVSSCQSCRKSSMSGGDQPLYDWLTDTCISW